MPQTADQVGKVDRTDRGPECGLRLGRIVHEWPRQQSARNPLSVNGLGTLEGISSASVQASTVADQASTASVQASTASVQASSATDKASGRPFGASSATDRASSVASELPRHPVWSRSASDQASTAAVQASSAALGAPIHAPGRLCQCPHVCSQPPPVTTAIPGSAPGKSDPVKRVP